MGKLLAVLVSVLVIGAQDPYTISADGKGASGNATHKPAVIVFGRTNLPDGSTLAVTLWYGQAKPGRPLGTTLLTQVVSGAYEISFEVFPQQNLPGAYGTEVVFGPGGQQADVRKKLGPRLREYRTTGAFTLGTADDLEKAVTERRRDFARRFDLLEAAWREAEAAFRQHAKARFAGGAPPKEADWDARAAAWMRAMDEGLRGTDRIDNLLVPDGERTVQHLAKIHEDVHEFIEGLGRVLANSKKPETLRSVIGASTDLAEKFTFARASAGLAPGKLPDLTEAIRAAVKALDKAVRDRDDASRRLFRDALFAAAKFVPRQAQAKFIEASVKAAQALAAGDDAQSLADDAALLLGDVVPAASAMLPK